MGLSLFLSFLVPSAYELLEVVSKAGVFSTSKRKVLLKSNLKLLSRPLSLSLFEW
jgi:hypothetical protein